MSKLAAEDDNLISSSGWLRAWRWLKKTIKNKRVLLRQELPSHIREIRSVVLDAVECGLSAVSPARLFASKISLERSNLKVGGFEFDLDTYEHVYAVGAGKASYEMAKALHSLIGGYISGGEIAALLESPTKLGGINVRPASHPLPTKLSADATEKILELIEKRTESDLFIFLLSGGASSMLSKPLPGITLNAERSVTELLLRNGADIDEMNCIRKHLSLVKGGRLQQKIYPATSLTLLISDVLGNDLSVIGSGPTVPDPSTYSDAIGILERVGVYTRVPREIIDVLHKGVQGEIGETPKPGEPCFQTSFPVLIGSAADACNAASERLAAHGFRVAVAPRPLRGDVGSAADSVASDLRTVSTAQTNALVYFGETTVRVLGNGVGGRNQELCLRLSTAPSLRDFVVCSIGTDGVDGVTDSAGALIDPYTLRRAQVIGLDPFDFLKRNDSGTFFSLIGDSVVTGPTGTNVGDLVVAVSLRGLNGANTTGAVHMTTPIPLSSPRRDGVTEFLN